MGEHASASREFDKSLRAFGQPLMIAAETTPTGDPGDTELNDPSSRKNLEGSL